MTSPVGVANVATGSPPPTVVGGSPSAREVLEAAADGGDADER
ncbi:hypothetical protein [Natrinema altunense]|nr:hypothetical protein [Natrinema altunense]